MFKIANVGQGPWPINAQPGRPRQAAQACAGNANLTLHLSQGIKKLWGPPAHSVERRHTHDMMVNAQRDAEKQSEFLNLVNRSVLLYGRRSITYVQEPGNKPRPVSMDMHSFSHFFELPRSEIIDPVGLGIIWHQINNALKAKFGDNYPSWKDAPPAERQSWIDATDRFTAEFGGSEYEGLLKAQEDAFPSDELHYAIGRTPTRSLNGFRTKASVVAYTLSEYWQEPFRDLDWGPQQVRMLVESIFEVAGDQTVEQWLGIEPAEEAAAAA